MSQYSDGGNTSSSDDYSSLDGYYSATVPTRPSFLTYIPSPGDGPYLEMNRQNNMKVPNYAPKSYNVLLTGNYRTVSDYSNMERSKN